MPNPQQPQVILHADMDAFFASVEVREHPELVGKPVLVGGTGRRGVVAAASYEARAFGCRSAQPIAVALRHCPNAIVLPVRHSIYQEVSKQVFAIFSRFSPKVEGLSIDEAFLDLSGCEKLLGPPRQVGEKIRQAIRSELDLTCSVGISQRKFIAKIASAAGKPDGIVEVEPGEEQAFLDPLPIAKLWGVGPRARQRLEARGVSSVADMRALDPMSLRHMFGRHGDHLARLARGIDARPVLPGRVAKSVSHEDTFAHDLHGRDLLCQHLLHQSTKVADRLARAGLFGRRVSIKIRDHNFRTQSRQQTLDQPTNQARVIYQTAATLLDELDLAGKGVRLTGVAVSQFRDAGPHEPPAQLSLSIDVHPSEPESTGPDTGQKVQDVLTEIRTKFGTQALFPAGTKGHRGRG